MDSEPTLHSLDVRQSSHEAVCEQFKKDVWLRLSRLEKIVIGTAAVLILGMGGVLWQVVAASAKLAK